MKTTNMLVSLKESTFKSLSPLIVLLMAMLLSSCDTPTYSPEISCVELEFEMNGVSVEPGFSCYDTTSYYESVIHPATIYALVGDTVTFGNLSSKTISSSPTHLTNVTYFVTNVAEKSLCLVAKNAAPERVFSGSFDSAGTYTLAMYPSWNCDDPNFPNGFSWAINLKIIVVDDISEIPGQMTFVGVNTFNLRLSRSLLQDP